jgi:membrane protein DedA with SNARE-associated domain
MRTVHAAEVFMGRNLVELLVRHGAPVLFLAQTFGIFGLPIPDELLLTAAGALVQKSQLSAPATFVAAVGGCLTGITLSYALGRRIGFPVLQRRLRVHPETFARAQRWFERFGGWLLTFGYFIPGVRHVTAIAAGTAGLDFPHFSRYAYPGGVFWCTFFLALGYYLGDRWREIVPFTHAHLAMVALIAVVALLVAAVFSRARRQQP